MLYKTNIADKNNRVYNNNYYNNNKYRGYNYENCFAYDINEDYDYKFPNVCNIRLRPSQDRDSYISRNINYCSRGY